MARVLKTSTLTDVQKNRIEVDLTLSVKQSFFQKKHQGKREESGGQVIKCYRVSLDSYILPLNYACNLIGTYETDQEHYKEKCRSNASFTGKLKDEQKGPALKSLTQLSTTRTSILGLYPGFGKTVIGAYLSCEKKLLTCVLIQRLTLTKQWQHTYNTFTNASVWIVGEALPPFVDVIICMDTRVASIPEDMRRAVGFLIIDEAHMFCTPTSVDCLLAFTPTFVLAETATLERDDDMHEIILTICGREVVFTPMDKPITLYKVLTGVAVTRKRTYAGDLDWHALMGDTLAHPKHNEPIYEIVSQRPNSCILILTLRVEHAEMLHEGLKLRGESTDVFTGKKKNYKPCRVLVGTISKVGTGFDASTFCPGAAPFDVVVIASSIKKATQMEQAIGRGFRVVHPEIFHLVDADPLFAVSHWRISERWYKSRNVSMGVIDRSAWSLQNTSPSPTSKQELLKKKYGIS